MMKIILNGAGGRMGRALRELLLSGDGSAVICAEVDKNSPDMPFKNMADYKDAADVIIDFSHHSATKELVSYAMGRALPLVICTTGQTEEELALIREAALSVPVFLSANMSLGIAVLCDFAKRAAQLFPDADIEIVEAHHNRKLDAPSGTALMLADSICEARPDSTLVYGHHGMEKRREKEIGVHSIRLGSETGMHEILISNGFETLTLKHNAHTRDVFAKGALAAAKFLLTKQAGLYDMQSIMKD